MHIEKSLSATFESVKHGFLACSLNNIFRCQIKILWVQYDRLADEAEEIMQLSVSRMLRNRQDSSYLAASYHGIHNASVTDLFLTIK